MKLIINIDSNTYKIIKDENMSGNPWEISHAIATGTPIPDNATPCDFCRYNPPSSTDGKPCCMCPATSYQKGGK